MGKNSAETIKSKLKLLVFMGIIIGILMFIVTFFWKAECHPYDFSQEYRQIEGYENIVFRDNGTEQDFCRSIWGLTVRNHSDGFTEHRSIDKNSNAYKILEEHTDLADTFVKQIVFSPDGNYILYVESVYRGTGVTDDEDVYYRVYDIKNDTVVTIYSGHRAFLLVDWQ